MYRNMIPLGHRKKKIHRYQAEILILTNNNNVYVLVRERAYICGHITRRAGRNDDDSDMRLRLCSGCDCGAAAVAAVHFNSLKEKRRDLRHETLNQAEDLCVMDQLRKHVGMVVHHLPQNNKDTVFDII